MRRTIEVLKGRLRLVLAVGLSIQVGHSAMARHVPNAAPGRLDNPAAESKRQTPSGTLAATATANTAAATAPTASSVVGLPTLPKGTLLGPGSKYVFVVDNHSTDCNDPSVPGPGAPRHPMGLYFIAPGVNPLGGASESPLKQMTAKGMGFCYYLPFSTNAFPNDKNHTGKDGYGLWTERFAMTYDGSRPQSFLPLGAPVAPDAPTVDLAQLREAIVSLVSLLGTPAVAQEPAALSLQETLHKRDVRIADKALPKPSGPNPKARS